MEGDLSFLLSQRNQPQTNKHTQSNNLSSARKALSVANKIRLFGLKLCPVVWLMGCEVLTKTLKLGPLLVLVCRFPVAKVSMERGVNVIL